MLITAPAVVEVCLNQGKHLFEQLKYPADRKGLARVALLFRSQLPSAPPKDIGLLISLLQVLVGQSGSFAEFKDAMQKMQDLWRSTRWKQALNSEASQSIISCARSSSDDNGYASFGKVAHSLRYTAKLPPTELFHVCNMLQAHVQKDSPGCLLVSDIGKALGLSRMSVPSNSCQNCTLSFLDEVVREIREYTQTTERNKAVRECEQRSKLNIVQELTKFMKESINPSIKELLPLTREIALKLTNERKKYLWLQMQLALQSKIHKVRSTKTCAKFDKTQQKLQESTQQLQALYCKSLTMQKAKRAYDLYPPPPSFHTENYRVTGVNSVYFARPVHGYENTSLSFPSSVGSVPGVVPPPCLVKASKVRTVHNLAQVVSPSLQQSANSSNATHSVPLGIQHGAQCDPHTRLFTLVQEAYTNTWQQLKFLESV
mmetsp:Transcript_12456/g.43231  ORF Transcript_12456/g.43231 Transcript_12456/m.43231 type:complete len:430 (-) Transcript_12456:5860-7149(-)